jgi:hypothetical protein
MRKLLIAGAIAGGLVAPAAAFKTRTEAETSLRTTKVCTVE